MMKKHVLGKKCDFSKVSAAYRQKFRMDVYYDLQDSEKFLKILCNSVCIKKKFQNNREESPSKREEILI